MGIRKALRPGEFVLSLGCIVVYVKFNRVLGGLECIDKRAKIKTDTTCCVAIEIDEDTLALGFIADKSVMIYKNGILTKTIEISLMGDYGIYGILTPPITID